MQFTRPLLLLLTLVLCSFKQDDNAYQGSFTASIDGKPFQVQDDQMFRGLLMNKSASMNGKIPARTVISAIFNGQSYNLTEDKLFTENIQFEMAYTDGMIGQRA